MTPNLLNKLACPMDKQDLQVTIHLTDTAGNIIEGMLHCQHCNRQYPIIYGLPILAPDEYREPALENSATQHWPKELPATS
jgi:uncharacterized protein YbaR (Trm112 family)